MTDQTAMQLLNEYLALERITFALLKAYVRDSSASCRPQGGAPVPDREQDARARELRSRPADSARQVSGDSLIHYRVTPGGQTMFNLRLEAGLLAVPLAIAVIMTARPPSRHPGRRSTAMWTRPSPSSTQGFRRAHAYQPGQGRPGVPEHRQGRISLRGAVRRGGAAREGQDGRLLQHRGGFLRPPGGRPGVRLRPVLHDRLRRFGYLANSGGFELGVGPSIVVLDTGAAKALTTTTARRICTRSSSTRRG